MSEIPAAGTVVTARVRLIDEIRANNKAKHPDPRLPEYDDDTPNTVTGPLEVVHVEAPWGNGVNYWIGDYLIDPTTIELGRDSAEVGRNQ